MNIKTTAIKILLSKTFLSASMLISIQRKKSYAGSLRANFQPTNGFYAGGRIEKKIACAQQSFRF